MLTRSLQQVAGMVLFDTAGRRRRLFPSYMHYDAKKAPRCNPGRLCCAVAGAREHAGGVKVCAPALTCASALPCLPAAVDVTWHDMIHVTGGAGPGGMGRLQGSWDSWLVHAFVCARPCNSVMQVWVGRCIAASCTASQGGAHLHSRQAGWGWARCPEQMGG